jgi:rhamnose utilization protein RhaD (predicted bifunctional aldolase and dehydrogenase)
MPSLTDLVQLSNAVGDPALDAAILGEGNTSARCDAETFWVKGSGCQLSTMGAADFVHLRFDRILALLDQEGVDEAALKAAYESAKVDPRQTRRPSVETLFHAVLLSQPGVQAVAHSHATAVNMLTCSPRFPEVLEGRLFPDEAVVMGAESVYIPYLDPGVELAKAIKRGCDTYRATYGTVAKVIYMQNHGVIAVGSSTTEALQITAMAIKAARIRGGALNAGGIRALPAAVVGHLLGRPDEKYRQAALAGKA